MHGALVLGLNASGRVLLTEMPALRGARVLAERDSLCFLAMIFEGAVVHQGHVHSIAEARRYAIARRVEDLSARQELHHPVVIHRAEIALAATVHSVFVVEAALRQDVPALWFVQESYSESVLRRVIQPFSWAMWRRALARAARVVFGSRETASFYEPFRESANFDVLYNFVDLDHVDEYCRDVSRVEARERLGVPDGKTLVVSVGNVCSRKDQVTTLEAVRGLVRRRADFAVHLVGAREEEAYVATVRALVERWGLEEWVRIVGETGSVYEHLRAADVFASSSLIESYSYAILEAMAFGLPIVASAAPGVREQVRPGINGRVFQPGDATAMAELLDGMISDEAGRVELGRGSRHLIETMPDPEEATRELERLMEGAWVRGVTV